MEELNKEEIDKILNNIKLSDTIEEAKAIAEKITMTSLKLIIDGMEDNSEECKYQDFKDVLSVLRFVYDIRNAENK